MKKLKIFIPIIMVLIFFSIMKKKYNEYQYYNSQEMKVLSSWMSEFLNG